MLYIQKVIGEPIKKNKSASGWKVSVHDSINRNTLDKNGLLWRVAEVNANQQK